MRKNILFLLLSVLVVFSVQAADYPMMKPGQSFTFVVNFSIPSPKTSKPTPGDELVYNVVWNVRYAANVFQVEFPTNQFTAVIESASKLPDGMLWLAGYGCSLEAFVYDSNGRCVHSQVFKALVTYPKREPILKPEKDISEFEQWLNSESPDWPY